MEFNIDFDDQKLMRGFVDIEKAAVIASKNTLNTMAFLTRKNAIQVIGSDFINRNNVISPVFHKDVFPPLSSRDPESIFHNVHDKG